MPARSTRSGELLVRPSQGSTQTYGGAIVLNAVIRLDRSGYEEQPLRRLLSSGAYPQGLHTLCPAGDVTIIDGKRWAFHPLDPVRYIMTGSLNRFRRLRRGNQSVQFEAV